MIDLICSTCSARVASSPGDDVALKAGWVGSHHAGVLTWECERCWTARVEMESTSGVQG